VTTDPQTARYRHRTTEIEAVQWTGSNADALRAFCGPDFDEIDPEDRTENPDASAAVRESKHGTWRGLEPGYWVVKIGEEFYEESPADFAAQFEPVLSAVPAPAACDCDAEVHIGAGFWHQPRCATRQAAASADLPAGEAYRLAVSAALRLGTGATWEAIRDRAEDLTAEVEELTATKRRLGLMVDEYGHGASTLSEKLKGVRDVVAFAERVVATSGPGPASAVQAVIDRLRAALDVLPAVVPAGAGEEPADETRGAWGTRPACKCKHPIDEHSVYGCANDCACEWMPKRKPAGGAQQPKEARP
jgi:hypothetical protein